jgi:hypothetical protein
VGRGRGIQKIKKILFSKSFFKIKKKKKIKKKILKKLFENKKKKYFWIPLPLPLLKKSFYKIKYLLLKVSIYYYF